MIQQINEINFKDNIPELKSRIDELTKLENGHLIWNGQKSGALVFKYERRQVYTWLYMIKEEKWIPKQQYNFEHCCDNPKCVSLEHWALMNTPEGQFKEAAYRLLKNSEEKDGCRLFLGTTDVAGYGQISFKNKQIGAHILAMMIKLNGPIPPNKIVRHKCKEKNCCAIDHLELGTHEENAKDKIRDGTDFNGSKHPNTDLTDEIVLEIYKSDDSDTYKNQAKYFSNKFNKPMTKMQIYQIRNGITWHTVTGHKKPIKQNKKNKQILDQNMIDQNYMEMQKRITDNIKEEPYKENDNHMIWQLSKDVGGYGRTGFGEIKFGAHRLSWMAFNKTFIPPTTVVRHQCGNILCVNPKHLEIGTYKDNSNDMKKHGTAPIGENHPACTISEKTVIMIYMSKILGLIQKTRATLFKVSTSIIQNIDGLVCWKETLAAVNIDEAIIELRKYIKDRPEWVKATENIDLDSLDTSKLNRLSDDMKIIKPTTITKNHVNTITANTVKMIYISKCLGLIQKKRAMLFKVNESIITNIDGLINHKKILATINIAEAVIELRKYIKDRPECG